MTRTVFRRKLLRAPDVCWLRSWAAGISDRGVPPVIGMAVVEKLRRDHQTARLRREG